MRRGQLLLFFFSSKNKHRNRQAQATRVLETDKFVFCHNFLLANVAQIYCVTSGAPPPPKKKKKKKKVKIAIYHSDFHSANAALVKCKVTETLVKGPINSGGRNMATKLVKLGDVRFSQKW